MPSVNPLLGSAATPEVAAGYAAGLSDAGLYDSDPASRDVDDSAGGGTNVKVAAILAGAVLFVVLLRRGGFRDMVAV
jgi:hypothetical protein